MPAYLGIREGCREMLDDCRERHGSPVHSRNIAVEMDEGGHRRAMRCRVTAIAPEKSTEMAACPVRKIRDDHIEPWRGVQCHFVRRNHTVIVDNAGE